MGAYHEESKATMNIDIRLCTEDEELRHIVNMAERHPYPEYDCEFSGYVVALLELIKNPMVRMWIAYEDEKPVGYLIAIRQKGLRNQISIIDIYFEPSHRGMNLIVDLIIKVRDWAREDKALRVQWTSKMSNIKWEKILGGAVDGDFEIKVGEYRVLEWEVV